MAEGKTPNFDFLADWSEDELTAAFGHGLTSDDRILLFVLDGIHENSKPELKTAVSELCKELWLTGNPAGAVCKALLIGSELDKSQLISLGAKKAANTLHAEKQTLYARACDTAKLQLDANEHPDWNHANFVSELLERPEFKKLSRSSLTEKVKEIFKERGLHDRIGKAKKLPS